MDCKCTLRPETFISITLDSVCIVSILRLHFVTFDDRDPTCNNLPLEPPSGLLCVSKVTKGRVPLVQPGPELKYASALCQLVFPPCVPCWENYATTVLTSSLTNCGISQLRSMAVLTAAMRRRLPNPIEYGLDLVLRSRKHQRKMESKWEELLSSVRQYRSGELLKTESDYLGERFSGNEVNTVDGEIYLATKEFLRPYRLSPSSSQDLASIESLLRKSLILYHHCGYTHPWRRPGTVSLRFEFFSNGSWRAFPYQDRNEKWQNSVPRKTLQEIPRIWWSAASLQKRLHSCSIHQILSVSV